jgi:hypothetical protein
VVQIQIRLEISHLQEAGDQSAFSSNSPAHLRAWFNTFLQCAWHKELVLQSDQAREVDSRLLIALVSQLTLLRVIGEITLILLSQCAGSKGI